MSDEEQSVAPSKVEVIPPSKSGSALATADFSETRGALMQRIEAWGARKVVEGWTKVISAERFYFEEVNRRNEEMRKAAESMVLLDENDRIVEAARRRIRAEIDKQDIANETEIDRLKFERERQAHEQEMERVKWELQKNPPPKTPTRSAVGRELDEIKGSTKYVAELKELEAAILREAGVDSEEELDDGYKGILRRARDVVIMGVK